MRPRNSSCPVAAPTHEVARAVQPRARLRGERIGDEALRRQIRTGPGTPAPGPPRRPAARRHAPTGTRPKSASTHIAADVGDRPADRHRPRPPARPGADRSASIVASVGPYTLISAAPACPAASRLGATPASAPRRRTSHGASPRSLRPLARHEQTPAPWADAADVDTLGRQVRGRSLRRQRRLAPERCRPPPIEQGCADLEHRRVEADRRRRPAASRSPAGEID